jgi:transposase, IS5 family
MLHLPTRLMTGFAILKFTFDLSDKALCERWVESPFGGKTVHCTVF